MITLTKIVITTTVDTKLSESVIEEVKVILDEWGFDYDIETDIVDE